MTSQNAPCTNLKAYTNVLCNLLGYRSRDIASEMFVHNIVDNFACRLHKYMYTFRQRILSSTNTIINITTSNTWISSLYMWSKWNNMLHYDA